MFHRHVTVASASSPARWWLVLLALVLLMPAGTVMAQEREGQDRIEAARQRIRAMIEKAEEMMEQGRAEAAAELRQAAEELKARIAQRVGRRERPRVSADRLEQALEQLHHAMNMLEEMGRRKEMEMVRQAARSLRRDLERRRDGGEEREGRSGRRGEGEREFVRAQIEVLELARRALDEAGRTEMAQALHRAIRAREVMLEGRRDEEAQMIRERSPGREDLVELLVQAEGLYREFDMPDRAEKVSRMTERLFAPREREGRRREGQRPRERPRRGERTERQVAQEQLEIMRMAMPALREAGRMDAADLLEHAIHARELGLEGRRDGEARHIRQTAPELAQQVEILALASRLWREFGNMDKAEAVGGLAERMWDRHQQRRERQTDRRRDREDVDRRRGGDDDGEAEVRRIEMLQEQLAALQQEMERIRQELQSLKRRDR